MIGRSVVALALAGLTGPLGASDLFDVGTPVTLAGGGTGDGGPALAASLDPQGLAAGGGRVYIADAEHNRVRVLEADGTLQTVVGSGRYGPGRSGDGALETDLQVPAAVARGEDGTLYVADLGNRRVCAARPDGSLQVLLDAAQVLSAGGWEPFLPAGLALAPDGTLYAADRGNSVVWSVAPGGGVRPLAGTGVRRFGGDAPAPAVQTSLADPRGLAVARDGAVYIAETGSGRLRRVAPDGTLTTAAGGGSVDWAGRVLPWHAILEPVAVAVDPQGRVAIADARHPRLARLEPGLMLFEVARFPDGDVPAGVAVDGDTYLVAAGRRVWRLGAAGGGPQPIAGNGALRASGDGGPARLASLYGPSSLAPGPDGTLYVADRQNHLVRRILADGTIQRVAGTGVAGFGGDGGPALAARFHDPAGLAFDAAGRLYVADLGNHRVRCVERDGTVVTVAGTGEAGWDPDGTPANLARLHAPAAVAVDAAGGLLIAEAGSGRIRRHDLEGTLRTVAGCGRPGPVTEGGPALSSVLRRPLDVRLDEAGGLLVADAGAHRVYRLGGDGLLRLVAGTGSPGRGADGSLAASAALNAPAGVLPDGAGGAWVADTGNGRLLHVDTGGVLRVLREDLGQPAGLAWDAGVLLFAEGLSGRVVGLPVERRWPRPEERLRLAAGLEVESVAALPAAGLLAVCRDPADGSLYVARRDWVDRLEASGQRQPVSRTFASSYALLAAPGGLYLGRPSGSGWAQPLALVHRTPGAGLVYDSVPVELAGADALTWAGDLVIYQASGVLLRLAGGRAEPVAQVPSGGALLQAGEEGYVYLAAQQTGEVLKVRLPRGGMERAVVESVAWLRGGPQALSWGEGGLWAAAGDRLWRLTAGALEEIASGFAPRLLDVEAEPGGGLLVLEGDQDGGRLLRLRPQAPRLGVWPATADLGALRVGSAGRCTLVVRNDGSQPVRVELAAGGPAVLAGEAVTLEPGQVRSLELEVRARAAGLTEEELVWQDETERVLLRSRVRLDGLAPEGRLSRQELDFGVVPVGRQAALRIEVENAGRADLVIERLAVEGGFTVGVQAPVRVSPGGRSAVEVRLQPTQRGPREGRLILSTNDAEHPEWAVSLRGSGGQARLELVAQTVDLGSVAVGRAVETQVVLRNAGEVPLRVDQVRTGQAQVAVSPRHAVVAPGQQAGLSVQFRPQRHEGVAGVLSFRTNDPEQAQVQLPYSGRGLSQTLVLPQEGLAFGPVPLGQRRRAVLPVRNRGEQTWRLTGVTSNSAQFRVAGAPGQLEPGQDGGIEVEFAPAVLGQTRGVLILRTDLPEAPHVEIRLEGEGRQGVRLRLSGTRPLDGAGGVEVSLWVEEATALAGIGLELELPVGAQWLGLQLSEQGLLPPGQVLVVDEEAGSGRRTLALSLAGAQAGAGVDGDGLLAALRLRLAAPGPLSVARAVVRSGMGLQDSLARPARVELGWPGDLDGDGRLDLSDLFVLLDRVGTPAGEEDPCDVNRDGRVDRVDADVLLGLLVPERRGKPALGPASPAVWLLPVHPNPFNAGTHLRFYLPSAQPVELVVYNALGQVVRRLVCAALPAGPHDAVWDGRTDAGVQAGTGSYAGVLYTAGEAQAVRLLLLR
ncbi:MAG: choice-of-anchor D domain-containing protein [Candidatus Latescibacterota bacterium]